MEDLKIPLKPEDVSPAWLTAALRARGTITNGAVASVDVQVSGEQRGIVGQIARISIRYHGDTKGAPGSLIVKLAAANGDVRAAANRVGLAEREALFYEILAPEVRLRTPRCYYSATNRSDGSLVLLLEDLSSARVGDDVAGCSTEDAAIVIDGLARFQSRWWGNPRLEDMEWLQPYGQDYEARQATFRNRWGAFIERFGNEVPRSLRDVGVALYQRSVNAFGRLSLPPRTVIHGDYKLDNMFFGLSGPGAPYAVIDWANVAKGRGAFDVAYFLISSVFPDMRRTIETSLVRDYHSTLVDEGVRDYSFDECLYDVRLSMLFVVMRKIAVWSNVELATARMVALAHSQLERANAVVTDHDLISLLG